MRLTTKKTTTIIGAAIGGAVLAWKVWKQASLRTQNERIRRGQRIIVVGAGFAGMQVARELSSLLPSESDGEIMLIDQNNFLLFTPMLTEVARGRVGCASHCCSPATPLTARPIRAGEHPGN